MRRLVLAIGLLLPGCSGDASPAPAPAAPSAPVVLTPPVAQQGDPGLHAAAARALAGGDDRAALTALRGEPETAARALLAAAARGTPMAQGNAPMLLARLGAGALPALAQGLQHQDVVQRKLSALALLQLGTEGRPLADALAAARSDPDADVRAVAELAWKRVTGDTTDLQKARAEHDAAQQRTQNPK